MTTPRSPRPPRDHRPAADWGRGVRARVDARLVPAAVLALVAAREGGRFCAACRAAGLPASPEEGSPVPLELDHRRPLAAGGDNHHSNLAFVCRSHNRGRGARAPGVAPTVPRWKRREQRRPPEP